MFISAISLNLLISVVCGKAIQTKNKEVVNSYVVARMIDSVERLTTGMINVLLVRFIRF